MKWPGIILAVLCSLFCLSSAAAGEACLTLAAPSGSNAVQVAIDDPETASFICTQTQTSGQEAVVLLTFTGLRPGRTCVTVSAQDTPEMLYVLTVDEHLNTVLDPSPDLVMFELCRNGDVMYDSCRIESRADGYHVWIGSGEEEFTGPETVHALLRILYSRDVFRWDGFNESAEGVLDGEGFWLQAELSDGQTLSARGSNRFPENYFPVVHELQSIIDHMERRPVTLAGQLWTAVSGLFSGQDMLSVGQDIAFPDIREFYYTVDASTYPSFYLRYHFSSENGSYLFRYEIRENGAWPQTEANITDAGILEMNAEEWAEFCTCLEGGTVRVPEDLLIDGDDGPWLFLYWGDGASDMNEFAFASTEKRIQFEDLCIFLKEKSAPPASQ